MDAFSNNNIESVADDIFGVSEAPDSGRIVAKPTDINSISADVQQPRRAIPLSIAMHRTGDSSEVPQQLGLWHLTAERDANTQFNLVKLLKGEIPIPDTTGYSPMTKQYLSLVSLAAHIRRHRLENPITVIEWDGRLLIEAGERRWLAHHLLNINLGEQWSKILAFRGSGKDSLWRQAGENTQRDPLNAVSMARQFALLIMDARESSKASEGRAYKSYAEAVKTGGCDRRFYAQVADGNIHRAPYKTGEQIQAAMNLSETQLARYRKLLRLTDDEDVNDRLWVRGDVESWAETAFREITTLPIGKVVEVINRANWTLDDLKALKDAPEPQRRPVTSEWMNKRVVTKGGVFGKVIAVLEDEITVLHENGMPRKNYHMDELTMAAERQGEPPRSIAPSTSTPPMFDSGYRIGNLVRSPKGNGEVVSVSGRHVGVRTASGTLMFDYTLLSKIVLNEADIEDDVDPDAPPPQREWREGWTDGEGGINPRYAQQIADEADSDKADSQPQIELPIIAGQSTERFFLLTLRTMAGRLEDKVTLEILNDILNMTPRAARELQAEDKLISATSQASEHVFAVVGDWLATYLGGALTMIENVGKPQ